VITARHSEIVAAPFTARVDTVEVGAGQRVRQGDRIARLDDTDLRQRIDGLRSQERSAGANAGASGAIARGLRDRIKNTARLVDLGVAPRSELRALQSELASVLAQGGAAMAQGGAPAADRKTLERQLAKADVAAPVAGIVMMVRAKPGAVIQQGEPLARVFDPRDLIVKFAVPKTVRGQLAIGARVELEIEGVDRKIWASIQSYADEEAPIHFTIVVADIDDDKLRPDELRVAQAARVRLADSKPS
jgi:multidrug efflux pump subunit AcrA (membrane-fusion protein)